MTVDTFTEQTVDAPPAQPPAYSLLVAADTANENNVDPHVFGQGARWSPEQIGGGGAASIMCPGGSDAMGEATNPVVMTADPFFVWAEDHCSMLSFKARDFTGRGRRQLEATQSFSVAREFQKGSIRAAESLNNYCLKDAEVIHGGGGPGLTPTQAVSLLEAALGETFKGRRGMIHMTPEAMTILGDGHLLSKAGQRWITPMGTVVASDPGYTTEDDGYVYAYATAPVKVLLGSVLVNPGSLDEAVYNGALDHTVNKVRIYAERAVVVQVDGGVNTTAGSGTADAMFKVQVNVTPWATHS